VLGGFLNRVVPKALAVLMGQVLTLLVISEFKNFPGALRVCMDFSDPTEFLG